MGKSTKAKPAVWLDIARRRYECGEKVKDLAVEYGVNYTHATVKSKELKGQFKPTHQICRECTQLKPLADFIPRGDNGKYRRQCRSCYTSGRKTYGSQYAKDNASYFAHKAAKRRAAKLQATLPGHDEALLKIYEASKPGDHVDHIIPLQHELVSGLHVPWNLQHLTGPENLRKSNYFNPEDHFWVKDPS